MAENSPYYEAGARLTYEVSPKLTLTGLVLNGWQNIRENNQAKALGTQIQWKPTDKLLLNSSTFYGNEQPRDSVRRRRYFHDFYVSYAATDRLSLALVFDVGKQESEQRGGKADTWHTGAAFVRYQLAAKWTAAARAEYYHADRGVTHPHHFARARRYRFQGAGRLAQPRLRAHHQRGVPGRRPHLPRPPALLEQTATATAPRTATAT